MGRGDADRHADHDARDGREPDERDRLDRRLPIAEVGDEDEGDDDEGGEAPRSMHPIGERREGENDDQERDVQKDRGEAVDQKIDHRRHRVEKPGGVVLQPGYADLDPASERKLRLGEPALQRRPSSHGPNAQAPWAFPPQAGRRAGGPARVGRLKAEALLDRRESGLAVEGRHAVEPVRRAAADWSSAIPGPPLDPRRRR